MQLAILIFIFVYFDAIFAQCEDNEYSTVGVLDDINEEIYNDDESVNGYSVYSWTSDDLNRILSGNGIPNHEVGTFPNPDNPNTISEQNINANFTLCPTIISESGQPVGGQAGAIAYAILVEDNAGRFIQFVNIPAFILVFGVGIGFTLMRKHTLNDNEIGVALKKDVILGGWIGFLIGLGLLGAGMDDQFGNIEWGISIVVSNLKTITIPLLYGYIIGNMLEASLSPPIIK